MCRSAFVVDNASIVEGTVSQHVHNTLLGYLLLKSSYLGGCHILER